MTILSSHLVGYVGFSRTCIITFAIGIISGFSFAYVLMSVLTWEKADKFLGALYNTSSPYWSEGPNPQDNLSETTSMQPLTLFHKLEKDFRQVESEVSVKLAEDVRVLCWILTGPDNHETKAKHVKATWGPRCNVLLFMSTEEDPTLPTVALNVTEGYDYLWGKTKEAFIYIYNNYLDSADWFLKADDDTYVIVENLRYALQSHSPHEPLYFGCRLDDYMSGGAGYVLSRNALQRLVEEGIPDSEKCQSGEVGTEDYELGKCLAAVDVFPDDSRDILGRHKFILFSPQSVLNPDRSFEVLSFYPMGSRNCCSSRAITFHHLESKMMYLLDYLIYELRAFGMSSHVPDEDRSQLHMLSNTVTRLL